MLTGDADAVGKKVAAKLKLDAAYTELLPAGKVDHMEQLLGETSDKGKLTFVGDGINDAPVLARADIGIAMGGLGSDAAIEAADVVIMTDEPSKDCNGNAHFPQDFTHRPSEYRICPRRQSFGPDPRRAGNRLHVGGSLCRCGRSGNRNSERNPRAARTESRNRRSRGFQRNFRPGSSYQGCLGAQCSHHKYKKCPKHVNSNAFRAFFDAVTILFQIPFFPKFSISRRSVLSPRRWAGPFRQKESFASLGNHPFHYDLSIDGLRKPTFQKLLKSDCLSWRTHKKR